MSDSDITDLVTRMAFSENRSQEQSEREDQLAQESLPAMVTVRRGNLMQGGTEEYESIPSTTRSHLSEFERSLTDDLTFVISKSETGDPYAGLGDLKDIFG